MCMVNVYKNYIKSERGCNVIGILWINRSKDVMLYTPNVSAITKYNQTDKSKKWLVFIYMKFYLQTK